MDINKNYYNILGVDKNSSSADIKKIFKKLAIQHHPDKGGDENVFKTINEAYSVLSDEKTRVLYDKNSKYGKEYHQRFSGFSNFDFNFNLNMDDVFNKFGFSFGGRNHHEEFKENLDIMINLIISTRDIYNAKPIEIKYKRYVHCESCDGTGFDRNGDSDICEMCMGVGRDMFGGFCKYCQGTGRVYSGQCNDCNGEKVKIKDVNFNLNNIKNVRKSGTEILKGYGHQSKYFREKKGTLKLNILYEHLMQYEFDNNYNLICNVDLHYEDAIKGVDYEYIHLDNSKLIIRIPQKTKDKDLIRINEKGLLTNQDKRGDLIFRVNIIIDYDRFK